MFEFFIFYFKLGLYSLFYRKVKTKNTKIILYINLLKKNFNIEIKIHNNEKKVKKKNIFIKTLN